jgi:uncharacterized membrane protein YcfT
MLQKDQPPKDEAKAVDPLPIAPAGTKRRLAWVDCAKGIGILLVVFGHVWRGLHGAGIVIPEETYQFTDRLIYSFHMPLFFFLSGLFIERSAQKGSAQFLKDKLATIAWPYLVWTFLQGGISHVLAQYTNSEPPSFAELCLGLFYAPYAHFWFLYVLFVYSLLFLLLYRLRLGKWGILVVALGMYAANSFVEGWRELFLGWLANRFGLEVELPGLGYLHPILIYFVYLAGGVVLSRLLVERLPEAPRAALGLALFATAFLLVAGVSKEWEKEAWSALLLAFVGTAGALAAAVLTARVPWLGWVRRLGELSMPIYLAHILAASGARIVLAKFLHVQDRWIHLVVGMAAGVLLPVALEIISRRTRTHSRRSGLRPRRRLLLEDLPIHGHNALRLGGPGELRTDAPAGGLAQGPAAIRIARQRFHGPAQVLYQLLPRLHWQENAAVGRDQLRRPSVIDDDGGEPTRQGLQDDAAAELPEAREDKRLGPAELLAQPLLIDPPRELDVRLQPVLPDQGFELRPLGAVSHNTQFAGLQRRRTAHRFEC